MTQIDRTVRRAALLLMDFHSAVVDNHGDAGRRAVAAAASALEHARRRRLPIFHVVPHYRPGYPELPSGPPFDDVKAAGLFCEPAAAAGIAAQLAPRSDEPIVAKCRYSPFFANDLLHLLHMRNVQTLVLAGIATSGVVLSAVRDAWDRDYRVIVLGDACSDPDPEAERVLLEKVIARQASVLSVGSWTDDGDADRGR
jgi:nicotinamidase-related amidase